MFCRMRRNIFLSLLILVFMITIPSFAKSKRQNRGQAKKDTSTVVTDPVQEEPTEETQPAEETQQTEETQSTDQTTSTELSIAVSIPELAIAGREVEGLSWTVSNEGSLVSKRFQVEYMINYIDFASYDRLIDGRTTYGGSSGIGGLPAGQSYTHDYPDALQPGTWSIEACVVPDYYSAEEGLYNDQNPLNNCAKKEFTVLHPNDATIPASGSELVISLQVPTNAIAGEPVSGLSWTVSNIGPETTKRFQVEYSFNYLSYDSFDPLIKARTTYGGSSGIGGLPAGQSYTNEYPDSLQPGIWRAKVCIIPDYYSEEEGLFNDVNPTNNCAEKDFLVQK